MCCYRGKLFERRERRPVSSVNAYRYYVDLLVSLIAAVIIRQAQDGMEYAQ